MFFDFHTHNRTAQVAPEALASYSLTDIGQRPAGQPFTIGLHPWDTDLPEAVEWVEESLAGYLQLPDCWALGEVGLDRLRGASFVTQNALLTRELEIGIAFAKPVVVHCVRAWSELRTALRDYPYPKAVHGFVGKERVLKELVADGWYISLRRAELRLLKLIPPDRLLLETDDSGLPIEAFYFDVAGLLRRALGELERQVTGNIQHFLGF